MTSVRRCCYAHKRTLFFTARVHSTTGDYVLILSTTGVPHLHTIIFPLRGGGTPVTGSRSLPWGEGVLQSQVEGGTPVQIRMEYSPPRMGYPWPGQDGVSPQLGWGTPPSDRLCLDRLYHRKTFLFLLRDDCRHERLWFLKAIRVWEFLCLNLFCIYFIA